MLLANEIHSFSSNSVSVFPNVSRCPLRPTGSPVIPADSCFKGPWMGGWVGLRTHLDVVESGDPTCTCAVVAAAGLQLLQPVPHTHCQVGLSPGVCPPAAAEPCTAQSSSFFSVTQT